MLDMKRCACQVGMGPSKCITLQMSSANVSLYDAYKQCNLNQIKSKPSGLVDCSNGQPSWLVDCQ